MSYILCNSFCHIINHDNTLWTAHAKLAGQFQFCSCAIYFIFNALNCSYEQVRTSTVYLFIRLFGKLPQSVTRPSLTRACQREARLQLSALWAALHITFCSLCFYYSVNRESAVVVLLRANTQRRHWGLLWI